MDPSRARRTPPPPLPSPARRLVEPQLPPPSCQPPLPFEEQIAPPIALEPELDPALQRRAASLICALIDVLRSRRPAIQLQRWAAPQVCGLLTHLSGARLTGVRLCSVRFQQTSPGVIEASARIQVEGAFRAAAFRLVGDGSNLVCTHLEVAVLPPAIHRAGAPRDPLRSAA